MPAASARLEPRANPDLLGQDRAMAVLASAWRSEQLAHAWLLAGPRGIGKATLAFRFARALLAGPGATDERLALPAEHPVFRLVAAGSHPDLQVLEVPRDAKTGRPKSEIPVDAVRKVTAALHNTPAMGGRRVVVVDGAELLNRSAANALLKVLEEPPAGAVLLLVSHQPGLVLATVRSRCAKVRLEPLAEAGVEAILAEQAADLSADEQRALARLARGSPGRALELAGAGSLALYRRLGEALGAEPPDRLGLHGLAGELARQGEMFGLAAPLALVQELLGRALSAAVGPADPPLYAGEPAALRRLAGRRPLDRWAGLWEKSARLTAQADGLNLDRFQVFLHILNLLALVGQDEGDLLGGLLGDPHVPG